MFDPESKFYNIPQGFPINTLNPTIEDKASLFQKMGAKVLTMIPSIRPHNLSNTIPNAKDACLTQGKEALAIFLNPNFLMLFHKLVAETHPEVLVRAYQIALDTFLNKRVFSERDLCNVFENKFSIQDIIGRNSGIVGVDTLFTAVQTNHLYTQPGFTQNVAVCIVIPAAKDSFKRFITTITSENSTNK